MNKPMQEIEWEKIVTILKNLEETKKYLVEVQSNHTAELSLLETKHKQEMAKAIDGITAIDLARRQEVENVKNECVGIVEDIKNKHTHVPSAYHHICYGGSTIARIDKWGCEQKIDCPYKGEDNWMFPMCKQCNGIRIIDKTLSSRECSENYAIKGFADEAIAQIKGLGVK